MAESDSKTHGDLTSKRTPIFKHLVENGSSGNDANIILGNHSKYSIYFKSSRADCGYYGINPTEAFKSVSGPGSYNKALPPQSCGGFVHKGCTSWKYTGVIFSLGIANMQKAEGCLCLDVFDETVTPAVPIGTVKLGYIITMSRPRNRAGVDFCTPITDTAVGSIYDLSNHEHSAKEKSEYSVVNANDVDNKLAVRIQFSNTGAFYFDFFNGISA